MPHNHNHINKAGKSEYEECERGKREKKNLTTSRMSQLIERSCLETGFSGKSEVCFSPSTLHVFPFLFFNTFYSLDEGRGRGKIFSNRSGLHNIQDLMCGFPAVHDISH